MQKSKFLTGEVLYCDSGVEDCPIRVTVKDIIPCTHKDGSVSFKYNTNLTYRTFEEHELFQTKEECLEYLKTLKKKDVEE